MVLKALAQTQTPGGCGPETGSFAGYCVEQGPEWLAGLLINPPGWVYVFAAVLVAGALGVLGYVHFRMGLDERDVRQMLASTVLVGSCGAGALVFRELGWFPYSVDVFGGWLLGAAVGVTLAKRIRASGSLREQTEANP